MKKQEFKKLLFNKIRVSRLAQKKIQGGNNPDDSNFSGCCTACIDKQGLCVLCVPTES